MQRYTVIYRNNLGKLRKTTCATTEGYSTVADIPKMITIKYGDACQVVAMIDESLTGPALSTVLEAMGATNIWAR